MHIFKTVLSGTIKKRKRKTKKRTNGRNPRTRAVTRKHSSISITQELSHLVDEEKEEEYRIVDDIDEEEAFDLKNSAPSQTYWVQPLGNFYFASGGFNSRNTGLGNLHTLTDELVLDILGLLEANHLGVLATVSKACYVFSNHEPLWRNLVLDNLDGGFKFKGSWKSTYVAANYPNFITLNSGAANVKVRNFYSDYLFQIWLCANLETKSEWLERDNIIRRKGISLEEFILNFEEPNKPVLLEGCLDNWAALEKWDRKYLVQLCGDVKFSVGPVNMKLEEYFCYSDQVREERPLYLFDPKFAEKVPKLGSGYEVPLYFQEDLFSVLGDDRPDYRWIIVGPAGSGSSFHIDPNSTSAWNAVIKGSKKWVLFPPDMIPPGVHIMNFYGATKSLKKRPIECTRKAGEVIFVPNGWWHLVINLEESIAITQNYVSRRNLLNVMDFLKRPNASELVSGTKDRVNLHNKFKNAIETSFPGIINKLEEEKKARERKVSFWDTITDSKVGAFTFSFKDTWWSGNNRRNLCSDLLRS